MNNAFIDNQILNRNKILFITILSYFIHILWPENFLFIEPKIYLFTCISFLILIFSVYYVWQKKDIELKLNSLDVFVFLQFAYLAVHYFCKNSYAFDNGSIIFWFVSLFFYFLFRYNVNLYKNIEQLLQTFIFLGFIQVLFMITQNINLLQVLNSYNWGGTYGNPGDVGNFLSITYISSISLFLFSKSKLKRLFYLGVGFILVVIIIITMARTAWIAIVASTTYLFASFYWKELTQYFKKKSFQKVIFSIITTIIFCTIGSIIMYKIKPESALGRFLIWKICFKAIIHNPIWGYGHGSFCGIYANEQIDFFKTNNENYFWGSLSGLPVFAFNDFLNFSIEFGLIFAIILIVITVTIFNKKGIKTSTNSHELALKAIIITLLVEMLFSYPLQKAVNILVLITVVASLSSQFESYLWKIQIKNAFMRYVLFVLMFVSVLTGYKSIDLMASGYKWKKAYYLSQQNPTQALGFYDELKKNLMSNRSFILNMGVVNFKAHKYEECVYYYEKYKNLFISTDMYLMLGESYEKLNNYPKAEEKYRMASNLIPHLFVPRYKLFKLYQKEGENEKALAEAKAISNLPIKVYSDIVKNIKTEVNEYLFNENSKPSQNETLQTDKQ